MYECGHKIGKTDGDKDSDEASDIVQAQSDDEDEISSDPKSREGIVCSYLKKMFKRDSPMANIQLVLSLLLLLSLILVLAHTNMYRILLTIGLPFKEEVPVPETYLHICLNYFNYLFSTSSFPEPFSFFMSLF
uniref:Uncharacterized protein n=2 Tax=Homalodisca liturata TaxID=320908 RepID=A0A1B6HV10_9HEMI